MTVKDFPEDEVPFTIIDTGRSVGLPQGRQPTREREVHELTEGLLACDPAGREVRPEAAKDVGIEGEGWGLSGLCLVGFPDKVFGR